MNSPTRPWALFVAATLAAFQAWLWFKGRFFSFAALLSILAVMILVTALFPRTNFSRLVLRVWAPLRRAGESWRSYRLRIAFLWLISAALSYAAMHFMPVQEQSPEGELRETYFVIPLILITFSAVLMALQATLQAFFVKEDTSNMRSSGP